MATGRNTEVIDGEFEELDDPNDRGAMIVSGPMAIARPSFQLACRVENPRKLAIVEKRLIEEANLAGTSFYYGWGSGKDAIEGPTVKLAMAAARVWGNAAVEQMPVQETGDAWIFTARFVDLETGFTLERQFRQSKNSVVHGKHDPERKADIRFQIGQSKASRNVVLNAIPEWLIDKAMEAAKEGVRKKIEHWIKTRTLAATQDYIIENLQKAGAPEADVLRTAGVANRSALDLDKLVVLFTSLCAIQDGEVRASEAFPPEATEKAAANDVDELRKKVSESLKPVEKTPERETKASPSETQTPERETPTAETETPTGSAAELEAKLARKREQQSELPQAAPASDEPSVEFTELRSRIENSKTVAGIRKIVASLARTETLNPAEVATLKALAMQREKKFSADSSADESPVA